MSSVCTGKTSPNTELNVHNAVEYIVLFNYVNKNTLGSSDIDLFSHSKHTKE